MSICFLTARDKKDTLGYYRSLGGRLFHVDTNEQI